MSAHTLRSESIRGWTPGSCKAHDPWCGVAPSVFFWNGQDPWVRVFKFFSADMCGAIASTSARAPAAVCKRGSWRVDLAPGNRLPAANLGQGPCGVA